MELASSRTPRERVGLRANPAGTSKMIFRRPVLRDISNIHRSIAAAPQKPLLRSAAPAPPKVAGSVPALPSAAAPAPIGHRDATVSRRALVTARLDATQLVRSRTSSKSISQASIERPRPKSPSSHRIRIVAKTASLTMGPGAWVSAKTRSQSGAASLLPKPAPAPAAASPSKGVNPLLDSSSDPTHAEAPLVPEAVSQPLEPSHSLDPPRETSQPTLVAFPLSPPAPQNSNLNDEVFRHYFAVETDFTVPRDFLDSQRYLSGEMRGVLVDWLVDVHYKFQLLPKTLFLTVSLLDRFLASASATSAPLRREELQLSGLAALLAACKYEEMFFPEVNDFVYLSDNAYSRKEIMAMESRLVGALHFELTAPTLHCFLDRFLEPYADDFERLCHTARYLAERVILVPELSSVRPSLLAAACLFLAFEFLREEADTPPFPETIDVYSRADAESCLRELQSALRSARPTLNASFRKYSRRSCGKAAYAVHDRLGDTHRYVCAARNR